MSGGSMDYLYQKVNDANFVCDTPERRAFAHHLKNIAAALHDIEWVDSCDCSPGDETKAILKCLGSQAVLEQTVRDAIQAANDLSKWIKIAGKK